MSSELIIIGIVLLGGLYNLFIGLFMSPNPNLISFMIFRFFPVLIGFVNLLLAYQFTMTYLVNG